jgi:capsular polysaccharide transport system ATP-binding protein
MIELRDVRKTYRTRHGRRVVLRGASIRFCRGRSVGILGLNGSGKSTLVRLLAGVELPDSGRIIRDARVSFPLGFAGTFDPFLTGRENALFIARLYQLEWKPYVAFIKEFAELGRFFDEPVKTYSSGMRARLAFATSIAANFDVYLVDEVTAVGDARFRERCAQAFDQRRAHSDVIMVSHNIGTIKRYCDAGAVLFNGHLEPYEDIDEAIAVYKQLWRV